MTTVETTRTRKRRLTGVVKSDAMEKTVSVVVMRRVPDPLYQKYVNRRSTFKAHDEERACKVGDTVEIEEHRPYSATKRWKVIRIVRRAQA